MILHTKKQSVSGLYDFAADPSAGAIGNVNTLVHIPSAALVTTFWASAIIAPLGGAGAAISFGYQVYTNVGTFVSPVALMPVTPVGGFVAGVPVFGVNLILNPIKFGKFTNAVSGIDIVMGISGAALTAGKLQFWAEYNENDL